MMDCAGTPSNPSPRADLRIFKTDEAAQQNNGEMTLGIPGSGSWTAKATTNTRAAGRAKAAEAGCRLGREARTAGRIEAWLDGSSLRISSHWAYI